ncbi:MAG: nucleotide sugar dehydrogenase [Thermoplasmata archaeon]|nr:MAG: nucleotide sugar dehydrogenase [Thermoplasmata archaeon]
MKMKEKIASRTAKICVIGLGYVGLPTAISFAEKGFDVIGADIDKKKVELIQKSISPLKDLNLDDRLVKVRGNGKLSVTSDIPQAVSKSDIILIIVPTPVTETKIPDLSFIESACKSVLKGLRKGQLVVLESSTFPGTTDEIVKPILEQKGLKAGPDFGLAYCPERYDPGDENHTLDKVARIIGAINSDWAETTKELYQSIIKEKVTIVKDLKTAEAAKIIENIQRDLNIALFNELAMIFQRMDIDVISVIEAASTKWNFIKYYPGPGVGGHCLPVDPYYLTHKAMELGYHPRLILAGRGINDYMPLHVVNLVVNGLNEVGKSVKGSKISILGISYKANVGDIRESPALYITNRLFEMGGKIFIFDPVVNPLEIEESGIFKCYKLDESLKDSDCVIIITDHDVIRSLSLDEIISLVKKDCVLVDTRNVFRPEAIPKNIIYRGIGRSRS